MTLGQDNDHDLGQINSHMSVWMCVGESIQNRNHPRIVLIYRKSVLFFRISFFYSYSEIGFCLVNKNFERIQITDFSFFPR